MKLEETSSTWFLLGLGLLEGPERFQTARAANTTAPPSATADYFHFSNMSVLQVANAFKRQHNLQTRKKPGFREAEKQDQCQTPDRKKAPSSWRGTWDPASGLHRVLHRHATASGPQKEVIVEATSTFAQHLNNSLQTREGIQKRVHHLQVKGQKPSKKDPLPQV